MKKTIIFLFAITAFVSIAFAKDEPAIPKGLEKSFHENFPDAIGIVWEKKDDVNVADFKENGIRHFAYFDANSSFLGVVRYITTDYMPFKTINELKKKYGDFGKMNAVEVSVDNGETFYFLNVIHKDKVKTVKVYSNGGTEIVKNNSK